MVPSGISDCLPPQVRQSIKRLIDAKRREASITISDLASETHRDFPTC